MNDPQFPELKVMSATLDGDVVDLGAAAAKAMPSMNRHRYTQSLKLTLSDGQVIDYEVRGLTKPKLQKRVESDLRYIHAQAMFARQFIGFTDKQLHWSIVTRISFRVGE